MPYLPPTGDKLAFSLAGDDYSPPVGLAVAFNLTFYPPYVAPDGSTVPLNFSGEYTPPAGSEVGLEFVPGEQGGGDAQYLFPLGYETIRLGSPGVRNQRDFVRPPGFTQFGTGTPALKNSDSYLRPNGIPVVATGRPSVILKDRPIVPPGFLAYASGTPNIINRNRHIFAGNIGAPALQVPGPLVYLYTRYLRPAGLVATAFSVTNRVSHDKQRVQLNAGISAPPLGTAWASHSPRVLSPAGAFRDGVGRPQVGGSRFLTPPGWDSQAFGTRIIPESQTVFPLGFREQWGQAAARNRWQFIRPPGFQTTTQEQFRWGFPRAYNLRQFITQFYDPDSELNPPPWSRWTEIANRNRRITHHSSAPLPVPEPAINNNARVINPAGMEPPGFPGTTKAGMVAHAIRPLRLDGIEPPILSRWAVVYNNARVLKPAGVVGTEFGVALIESNRRTLRSIGAIDSAQYGQAFIAPRVREISMEQRYSIGPPVIQLPEVKLYTRYLEVVGTDMSRYGNPALVIRFNIIAPRWVHRDFVGEPRVQNVTPEVRAFGRNSEEFGEAFVRLEWRPLAPNGSSMQLFGRPRIGDKRQGITVPGNQYMIVSDKLVVTKTGAPPYWPQNIIVERSANDGVRVGTPGLNQYVLYPNGNNDMLRAGTPMVRSNGVVIEAGIAVDVYGRPTIALSKRGIQVGPFLDSEVFEPSAPRLSPHTIWAVKEAPDQAKRNHPSGNLHYVGETSEYPPGARFGRAQISEKNRRITNAGIGLELRWGTPGLALMRRYIEPPGLQAYRMGWQKIGDGKERVVQFASSDTMVFGTPSITAIIPVGPRTLRPGGIAAPVIEATHWASLLHRNFRLTGFDSMRMGSSRGDAPYQWQTLHVGPPMPTIPNGFNAERFGTAWISPRVRELAPSGFNAFLSEYDIDRFNERMRVRNALVPVPPAQGVGPVGVDSPDAGVPNVRLGARYIVPDGNADQYRKGAF